MLYTLSMVWAVISNVQKSTVSRNPRNSVVKLPLRVRELQRVKKNWKKRTKSKKNAKEVFYALEPLHLEE